MTYPLASPLSMYSGRWYAMPHARSSGTLAVTALRCYFHTIYVPTRTRFSNIGCATSAGVGATNGRVGLYTMRDGKPFLKVFESASFATTGIGALSSAFTGPAGSGGTYLEPGHYFGAFCSDGAPTLRVVVPSVDTSFGIATLTTTTNVSQYMYAALASLSMPADASGSSFTFVTGNPPGVLLQVA